MLIELARTAAHSPAFFFFHFRHFFPARTKYKMENGEVVNWAQLDFIEWFCVDTNLIAAPSEKFCGKENSYLRLIDFEWKSLFPQKRKEKKAKQKTIASHDGINERTTEVCVRVRDAVCGFHFSRFYFRIVAINGDLHNCPPDLYELSSWTVFVSPICWKSLVQQSGLAGFRSIVYTRYVYQHINNNNNVCASVQCAFLSISVGCACWWYSRSSFVWLPTNFIWKRIWPL